MVSVNENGTEETFITIRRRIIGTLTIPNVPVEGMGPDRLSDRDVEEIQGQTEKRVI